MHEFDHRILYRCLSSSEKDPKNSGLNEDSNLDPCDAGSAPNQLSHQANGEQFAVGRL